jgi:UDPglucose 6-dehydrogenase
VTQVAIVGLGYVGVVTAACLAEKGHRVIGVDVDKAKVERLNAGIPPVHETGLAELLSKHLGRSFVATTDLGSAVRQSEVTLIAVGTPTRDGRIDLTYVAAAAREIGGFLGETHDYHVVAVKSTVVPGTTDSVVLQALESASKKRAGVDFGVGVNPEFLTEGRAVEDFMNPDRIVVGGVDERSTKALEQLYSGFPGVPIIVTNNKTAELIKYTSNALLATMISFSNEIADLASSVGGVDASDVMRGVHESRYFTSVVDGRRIAADINSFLAAGCGFGGSCLPKDVKALAAHGAELGREMRMLRAVLDVNAARPTEVMALLDRHFESLQRARITVLGLAFKPNTDDVRESPAIPVVDLLLAAGAEVTIHDPVASRAALDLWPGRVTPSDDLQGAIAGADAIVLITRWDEYLGLAEILDSAGEAPLVVDGRRMLEPADFQRYEGIGL